MSTGSGSDRVDRGQGTFRFIDEFPRNVDSRYSISVPGQFKRQSSISTRHIKYVCTGFAVENFDEEFSLGPCMLGRNCFTPEIERHAVEEVFKPVAGNLWLHSARSNGGRTAMKSFSKRRA